MKKFSEFVAENTNMNEGDHPEAHDHAMTVGRRFKAYYERQEDNATHHAHIGALHPKDVEKHGKALVKAGFTKHEGEHAPITGNGDATRYHKYTKGDTTVHVATKGNTWSHNLMTDNRPNSHHHVEIHTPRLHEQTVVVAEAASANSSADTHREAVHIGANHSANHVHAHGEHSGDDFDGHIGQIHPLDVHRHGKALEAAGFKYHGKGQPAMGAHSDDHGEYHTYSKGNTHVHVSVKPNTPGTTGHEDDKTHHHVEVTTDH